MDLVDGKSSYEKINNATIRDVKGVASYGPPRSLFFFLISLSFSHFLGSPGATSLREKRVFVYSIHNRSLFFYSIMAIFPQKAVLIFFSLANCFSCVFDSFLKDNLIKD